MKITLGEIYFSFGEKKFLSGVILTEEIRFETKNTLIQLSEILLMKTKTIHLLYPNYMAYYELISACSPHMGKARCCSCKI